MDAASPGATDWSAPNGQTPPHWTLRKTPHGVEIRCARCAGEGRAAAWIFICVLIAICGYGDSVFALGWWEGAEILAGEVILFLLLLAGLAAGLYLVSAMFGRTTYLLGPESLAIITAQPILGRSVERIDRRSIRAVIRASSPAQEASDAAIWRTLVVVDHASADLPRHISLEGESEAESRWLAGLIADWAGLPVRVQQHEAA